MAMRQPKAVRTSLSFPSIPCPVPFLLSFLLQLPLPRYPLLLLLLLLPPLLPSFPYLGRYGVSVPCPLSSSPFPLPTLSSLPLLGLARTDRRCRYLRTSYPWFSFTVAVLGTNTPTKYVLTYGYSVCTAWLDLPKIPT
ncbi:hypothetical protein LX36DRAFT_131938 [Colletotrichum falcatum]|nr:hypothetical protein LX36DRAFT_131938 [Colletotrichum falcatum]